MYRYMDSVRRAICLRPGCPQSAPDDAGAGAGGAVEVWRLETKDEEPRSPSLLSSSIDFRTIHSGRSLYFCSFWKRDRLSEPRKAGGCSEHSQTPKLKGLGACAATAKATAEVYNAHVHG
jgi:hypothetical protein